MDLEGFGDWLSEQRGVIRAAVADNELLDRISREESSVVSLFGTPVDNSGLSDCLLRRHVMVALVDDTFWLPNATTMVLRDQDGEVIGHAVTQDMAEEFSSRDDVIFLSDDFIIFEEKLQNAVPIMELKSVEYLGEDGSLPPEASPVIWFPSTTSSVIILGWFGESRNDLATAMIGIDLRHGTARRS